MVYEFQCQKEVCKEYGVTKDSYLPTFTSPNPSCPACGRVMKRVFLTPPRIGWSKPIGEYGDPNREGYNPDGFVAYRVNSTRNADGSPEEVFIRTRQQQVEFAKAEGLRLPDEINSNAELSRDGKTLSTRGCKGQWV